MKVAKKISEVMKQVEYLKKDGKVAYGSTRYNYLSEEKITSEIRKAMADVGLIIYPSKMEIVSEQEVNTRSGKVRVLNIVAAYHIKDIESGEFIEIQTLGEGMDSGDKAIYKAMTGAYKYAQRQTFMIPTGDDPDKVSSDELNGDDTLPEKQTTKKASKEKQEKKEVPTTKKKEAPATKKQLFAVVKLSQEIGYTPDEMSKLIDMRYSKDKSGDLTVSEASDLIKFLQEGSQESA